MENKSTRQLIEAANRKCEMRWKVLAFNPDEDNKLVKEFKDFDYITVNLTTTQSILLILITIVVNVLLMYYVLIPDIKKDSSQEMIENEYYYENIY